MMFSGFDTDLSTFPKFNNSSKLFSPEKRNNMEALFQIELKNRSLDFGSGVGCCSLVNTDDDTLDRIFYLIQYGKQKEESELNQLISKYVNKTDSFGNSPLKIALRFNKKEIISKILSHPKLDYHLPQILVTACQYADPEIINELLDRQFDINEPNDQGETPLMLIAQKGDYISESIVQKLFYNKHLNVNMQNNHGETALIIALNHINTRSSTSLVCKLLYHSDIDLTVKDKFGRSVIKLIMETSNSTLIFTMIDKIDSQVFKTELKDALIVAVKSSLGLPLIKKIIERSDINYRDEYGNTALYYACESANVVLVQLLLSQKELDLSVSNNYGQNIVQIAINKGNTLYVNMFLEHLAILKKDDLIKEIFDTKDNLGETPFLKAVKENRTDMVKLIYDVSDVNPNVMDMSGKTPLIYAIKHGDQNVFSKLLADPKINVNLADYQQMTPLMHAISQLALEDNEVNNHMAFALLNRPDININLKNLRGYTVLTLLIHIKHEIGPKNKGKLQYDGLDSNFYASFPTCFAQTSPAGLSMNNFSEHCKDDHIDRLISILIQRKDIDINIPDYQNTYPLHLACEKRDLTVFNLLMSKESTDLNCTNNHGKTPLIMLTETIKNQDKKFTSPTKFIESVVNTDKIMTSYCAAKPITRDMIDLINITNPVSLSTPISIPNMTFGSEFGTKIKVKDSLTDTDEYSEQFFLISKLVNDNRTNLNMAELKGESALLITSAKDDLALLNLFLSKQDKVDVNTTNHTGETPLMKAVKEQLWGNVTGLLKSGADVTIKNKDGLSVLEIAGDNKSTLDQLISKNVIAKKGWFGG